MYYHQQWFHADMFDANLIILNRKEEEKGPVVAHLMVSIYVNQTVQCLYQWISI